MKLLRIIAVLLLVASTQYSVAQNRRIDSLFKASIATAHDSVVFAANFELAIEYFRLNEKKTDAKALRCLEKAFQLARSMKDLRREAKIVNQRAQFYRRTNRLNESVQEFKKLETLYDRLGDKKSKASALYGITSSYFYSNQINTAIKYGKKYMELVRELDSKADLAKGYMVMGILYSNTHKNDKEAEICFLEEIKLKQELGDTASLGVSYNNLGSFLIGESRLAEAELYLRLAIDIGQKVRDSLVVAYGQFELGNLYASQNKWKRANESYAIAIGIWENSREDNHKVIGYRRFAQTLFKAGEMEKAYRFLEKHLLLSALNDSLQNVAMLNSLEAKYEGEKNARENKILTQKDKLREAKYKQSQLVLWAVSGGLLLVLITLFFIYRGLREKKTANKKLAESYALLEEKNSEILGSIHYAKRIQDALLKEDKFLKDCPFEHFVFFRPRDIVSGDFYWSMRSNSYIYVAVADCTGHGVPGALLTMLGSSFLNEMVSLNPAIGPAELLNGLRDRIIRELNQEASFDSTRDGMDISLIRVNITDLTASWSGANNPLWVVNKGNFQELKADKQPVGFSHHMATFNEHALQLEKGSILYLFSDGYADQFGGEKLKKLKSSGFRELILSLSAKSLSDQKMHFGQFFDQWKSGHEQLDDVCVAGLRL